MNEWIQKSIDLAAAENYLDELANVYPPDPNPPRSIDPAIMTNLRNMFDGGQDVPLLQELVRLTKNNLLFPVKDVYLGSLKEGGNDMMVNNPQTVTRIVNMIRSMDGGFDGMVESITSPIEVNRTIGPMFTTYINEKYTVIPAEEFRNSTNGIRVLAGGDAALKLFAKDELDYHLDKGLDIVAKVNEKYVIGEGKFLTDNGGHQNSQFRDAMHLIDNYNSSKAIVIAILDGVVWIPSGKFIHRTVCTKEKPCLSALLLDEFFDSLR